MVKFTITRVRLTIPLTKGWSFKQLDVNNIFLNGYLIELVYMLPPFGFEFSPSLVCHLKVIYSLKQALGA